MAYKDKKRVRQVFFTTRINLEEQELIESVKDHLQANNRTLLLTLIKKYVENHDDILNKSARAVLSEFEKEMIKNKMQYEYTKLFRAGACKFHHEIYLAAMDLTNSKINSDTIMEKIINPAIKYMELDEGTKEGLHSIQQLKTWIEKDYGSFVEYSEIHWHEKTSIYDMIKRLETLTFAKMRKKIENDIKIQELIIKTKQSEVDKK